MTEHPAVALSPLQLARARKCDRDVKLHLPEALYDDLAHVARTDRRPVSVSFSPIISPNAALANWLPRATSLSISTKRVVS